MLQVTQTEVERLKSSYMQAVRDAAQIKKKFQETSKGDGSLLPHMSFPQLAHAYNYKACSLLLRADKERDRAKERNVKALAKLYELQNEYVLSMRAAQVYHQQHYTRIQPSLLQALQILQEEMVLVL